MTEPIETFMTYTSDPWAIERTLRFFQAAFWTASLIGPATYTPQADHSKAQIHFARRFYRAFKWADCWYAVFTKPETDYGALHENVRMLKDSTLGMYLFLDMIVLPTAVGAVDERLLAAWVEDLTGVSGGSYVIEHTGMVCWFYAVLLSIVLGLLELSTSPAAPETTSEKNQKKTDGKAVAQKGAAVRKPGKPTSAIVKDIVCNSLDLIIPGTIVGYFKIDPVYVSIGMMASSLITMRDTWNRIYAEKERNT